MDSPTPPTVPSESRRIVIEGLERPDNVDGVGSQENTDGKSSSSTFSMIMHEDDLLSELWNRVEECGFRKPGTVTIGGLSHLEESIRRVVSDHEEVVVVADDQVSDKHTIRITEPLILHANTHHGEAIDFNIAPQRSSKRAVEANCGFHVSFERTPRMPDDNKLHQLPGSLGSYDLFSVDLYASRLPANISESGGVFFPMWQREAMWLNFKSKQRKCAVRVFMGHVNAISGLTMEETAEQKGDNRKQDYVVIPGQLWLDGICVAPGVVRQFVAMPLGSGYTVEGQKTSKEQHGGLQLEITPELFTKQRLWSYGKDYFVVKSEYSRAACVGLDEKMTPEQLGCKVGDVLRSYPVSKDSEEPLRIKHLGKSGVTITCQVVNPPRRLHSFGGDPVYQPYGKASTSRSGNAWEDVLSQPPQHSAPLAPQTMTSLRSKPPTWARPRSSRSEAQPASISPSFQPFSAKLAPKESEPEYAQVGDDEKSAPVQHAEPTVIETKDIKAMGLAAGGKLIQDIYKDPHPATIWNHAAARILNVHILDPVSCEKVTHIVPKPPPIDAKAYTAAGGQYFVVEEKVDERLDGGDFDNVKSVSQMDQHVGISTEPEFDPTKPKMCTACELRLCDCITRPCDHQFCNICIKRIEQNSNEDNDSSPRSWKCPTCDKAVSHVAGFSAPMNLPGEEPLRIKVPVNVLKIEDGRVRFASVQKTRI